MILTLRNLIFFALLGTTIAGAESDELVCPGFDSHEFCDCRGDCFDHPNDWCSCQEAVDCCRLVDPDDERMVQVDDDYFPGYGEDRDHNYLNQDHPDVLVCPDFHEHDFCDCQMGCIDHPDWCSCQEAMDCCDEFFMMHSDYEAAEESVAEIEKTIETKVGGSLQEYIAEEAAIGQMLDVEKKLGHWGQTYSSAESDELVCPGFASHEFCDCRGDCFNHPNDWCSCQDALDCCKLVDPDDERMVEVDDDYFPGYGEDRDHNYLNQDHPDVLVCPDFHEHDFCDCQMGCIDHPDWCSCQEAMECCDEFFMQMPPGYEAAAEESVAEIEKTIETKVGGKTSAQNEPIMSRNLLFIIGCLIMFSGAKYYALTRKSSASDTYEILLEDEI